MWIVDPVDGTRQFVRGEEGFCTLVALAHRGVVHASWTYAPAGDRLATAVRGRAPSWTASGCTRGRPSPAASCGWPMSHPDYTTDEQKRDLLALRTPGVAPRPCGSAGLENLAVALRRVRRHRLLLGGRRGTTRPVSSWSRRRAAPT
ncbi:3'(2'),5'-bisphosphate nucleotidase CysQ [Streptomyces tendae]